MISSVRSMTTRALVTVTVVMAACYIMVSMAMVWPLCLATVLIATGIYLSVSYIVQRDTPLASHDWIEFLISSLETASDFQFWSRYLGFRSQSESPSPATEFHHHYGNISDELDLIMEHILTEYIHSWYGALGGSDDTSFPDLVNDALEDAIVRIKHRMSKLDRAKVTSDLMVMLAEHIHMFRTGQYQIELDKLNLEVERQLAAGDRPESIGQKRGVNLYTLPSTGTGTGPAPMTPDTIRLSVELKRARSILHKLMTEFLHPDVNRSTICSATLEGVLGYSVVKSMADTLCEPDFLFRFIVILFGEPEPSGSLPDGAAVDALGCSYNEHGAAKLCANGCYGGPCVSKYERASQGRPPDQGDDDGSRSDGRDLEETLHDPLRFGRRVSFDDFGSDDNDDYHRFIGSFEPISSTEVASSIAETPSRSPRSTSCDTGGNQLRGRSSMSASSRETLSPFEDIDIAELMIGFTTATGVESQTEGSPPSSGPTPILTFDSLDVVLGHEQDAGLLPLCSNPTPYSESQEDDQGHTAPPSRSVSNDDISVTTDAAASDPETTVGPTFTNVSITGAELHPEPGGSRSEFILYTIQYDVDVPDGAVAPPSDNERDTEHRHIVRRRYREFSNLHTRLENNPKTKKFIKVIKFPKSILMKMNRKARAEERQVSLLKYLQRVVSVPHLNCCPDVIEFLAYGGNPRLEFVKAASHTIPVVGEIWTQFLDSFVTSIPDRFYSETVADKKSQPVKKISFKQCPNETIECCVTPTSSRTSFEIKLSSYTENKLLQLRSERIEELKKTRIATKTRVGRPTHRKRTSGVLKSPPSPTALPLPLTDALLNIVTELFYDKDSWICFEKPQKFVRNLFGDFLDRWLLDNIYVLSDRHHFCFYLSLLRESLWPSSAPQGEGQTPTNDPLTTNDLKSDAVTALENIFPKFIRISVGYGNFHSVVYLLMESLCNPDYNRILIYKLFEYVVATLVNESRDTMDIFQ